MNRYKKGYRAENELTKLLSSLGYAVLRAPKSGKNTVDVIACKNGNIFVFECKHWKSNARISKKQISNLLEFAKKAGGVAFIALKSNTGWIFLRAEDVMESGCKISNLLIARKGFSVEFFERY